jgi:Bacterial Ig-like domain (group 3)
MLKLARFVRRGPVFATAAVTVLAVSLAIPGAAAAALKAPDTATATTVTTSLSGGGQSGTSITVPVGTPVFDTATLSGTNADTAMGTVTYEVYSDALCTVPVTDTTSMETITGVHTVPASDPVTLTTAGTYYWQATYSGDANNLTSTSTCGVGGEVETVTAAGTSLGTTLSSGDESGTSISVQAGTPVTDAATLTGPDHGAATGTITYNVYSDSLCTTLENAGTAEDITTPGTIPASLPVTIDTVGTYYWQASYSGDANNLASVSACNTEVVTVTAAITSVTTLLSENSVTAGTPVTDTATLSGAVADAATGTITYDVYSDAGCTDQVSTGTPLTITTPGTMPTSAPVTLDAAGTYYWQASYSGDANNLSSTSTCGEVEVVTPANTTTTTMLSASSVAAGVAVTDSATLTGAVADAATGTVTYNVYSDAGCTDLVTSSMPLTITTPGALPDSGPLSLTTAGTYYWQASYSGDANNLSSTSTCGEVETVTPADTGTATSLSGGDQSGLSISVPAGTAVTDTATLSGTDAAAATGTITYDVYSDAGCTDLVSTGTPLTITTPGTVPASDPVTLDTGTYYWQATYSGDPSNNASVSTCGAAGEVETVTPAVPTPTTLRTQLSGSENYWLGDLTIVGPGTAVTDSATLSGANATQATGTVTYTVYSLAFSDRFPYWQSQWEPVASGGTVTVTAGSVPDSDAVTLPPGIYYWQASYSGDAYNAPSVSQLGSEVEYVIYAPGYRFGSRFG